MLAVGLLCLTTTHADSSAKFGVNLFNSVAKSAKPNQNVAVSPFSVDSALTMTYLGAVGTTRTELGSALGIASTTTAKQLGEKFKAVNAGSDKYTLQSANAMYLGKPNEVKPEFKSNIANEFKADIKSVDFRVNAEGVRQEINTFVEGKTNNKIKDLLPQNVLTADTVFVLVNAVYFKASWKKEFNVTNTRKNDVFILADGQHKHVDMMSAADKYRLGKVDAWDGAQVLEMPYKGGETSMIVILPKNGSGLQSVESALTAESLKTALADLRETEARVYLPKFKVNWEGNLIQSLKKLGVKDAFGGGADFSGITPTSGVYISRVQHKVFVEVNEEGTEAAAATAVVSRARSGDRRPLFRADRPFLFLIRHNPSNTVLFIGKIADPSAK